MSAPLLHPDGLKRCPWPKDDPLYVAYHDDEWGVPEFDDRALYEKLVLDGFQAGLSWITILRKRDNFRRAFDGFDPAKIARYAPAKVEKLMQDAGIVRNRLKIEGAVLSARAYLDVMEKGPGFSALLWNFLDGKPKVNHFRSTKQVPAETALSRADVEGACRRAASSSSGRPSSTPSCRRSAWSTTTWSTATAIRRCRPAPFGLTPSHAKTSGFQHERTIPAGYRADRRSVLGLRAAFWSIATTGGIPPCRNSPSSPAPTLFGRPPAAQAAHDLRNLLTTLGLHLETLQRLQRPDRRQGRRCRPMRSCRAAPPCATTCSPAPRKHGGAAAAAAASIAASALRSRSPTSWSRPRPRALRSRSSGADQLGTGRSGRPCSASCST